MTSTIYPFLYQWTLDHSISLTNNVLIISVRSQGLNLCPLHWKLRILTTAPPGKSLEFLKYIIFNNCKRRCMTPPTVREITNKNSNKIPFLTQLTGRQSHTPPILLQEGVSKYILCLHMYKSFSRICTEKWNCWNESRLSSNCTRDCKVTCQCTPLLAVGEYSCFHTFSPPLDAIRLFHLCQSAG